MMRTKRNKKTRNLFKTFSKLKHKRNETRENELLKALIKTFSISSNKNFTKTQNEKKTYKFFSEKKTSYHENLLTQTHTE